MGGFFATEDQKTAGYVTTLIYNHLRAVRDWHNDHPFTTIPGRNPLTGSPLSELERSLIPIRPCRKCTQADEQLA